MISYDTRLHLRASLRAHSYIMLPCRMSRDQRVQDNWAFLHAAEVASKTGSPVAVAFNLVNLC